MLIGDVEFWRERKIKFPFFDVGCMIKICRDCVTDVSEMAVITIAEVQSPFIVKRGGQRAEGQLLKTVNAIEQIEGRLLVLLRIREKNNGY